MVTTLSNHARFLILGLLLLLALISLSSSTHAAQPQRTVLILHSYHPGLIWTDGITLGISEQLSPETTNLRLHVEYMDTKRNPGQKYLAQISELLEHKLETHHFDLVITADNDALRFALDHNSTLFNSTPVVFCGVNEYRPELIASHSNITGVAEQLSAKETLDTALSLHPNSDEIIIIGSDTSITAQAVNDTIDRSLSDIRQKLDITHWRNLSAESLQQRLSTLKPGQLVFLSTVITKDDGSVLSFVESIELVRNSCTVPIYGYWDFFLGHGIIGGKLVSGNAQGRAAATLAQRILNGEAADQIPVITNEANVYLFDDFELQRFGITPAQLPAGSQRINLPKLFYSVAKQDFWLVGVSGGLLILLILLLLWNLHIRRIAEEAVCEKEERLRLALDGSQDGFWDWDVTTGDNIVDERWCTMLGYQPDEIEPSFTQWTALVHPDDLEKTTDLHQRCMDGEFSHFASEFRMRTKQGHWKWILGRGMVVCRDEQGRTLRLTGTHKDISQQKATEQALKDALSESETARNKIDAILTSLTDGLIVSDKNHRVIMLNQAAQQLLNIDSGQAIGCSIEQVVDGQVFNDELSAILNGDKDFASIDVEMVDCSRQETRIIQARFSPIHDDSGKCSGAITLLQDVTRNREMAQLKSEFISTAAHELRTPLTVMLGFSDLLLDNDNIDADAQREYLKIISTKSESLATIVDDLLDLSRIESGRLITLDRSMITLHETLQPLIDQYRDSCPHHQFITTLNDLDTELFIDQNKMGQVMENLLSNAVKYSPDGGLIDIRSERTIDGFRLTISDQGIGMTPAQLERVFDKFYRVDATNTAVGGLGLGMSIVRNIIETHGGNIWVESNMGRGTSAHILLPVSSQQDINVQQDQADESIT